MKNITAQKYNTKWFTFNRRRAHICHFVCLSLSSVSEIAGFHGNGYASTQLGMVRRLGFFMNDFCFVFGTLSSMLADYKNQIGAYGKNLYT
jgi:hypothetical protein